MSEELSVGQRKSAVKLQWGVKIPLRDGICLHATLYLPAHHERPGLTICTLTPYTAQMCHDYGMYFAGNGIPFLAVDVRGRGNSEGEFWPMLNDAQDGYDVVEWAAKQDYCNGQVAMWGGSYAACAQWLTAAQLPPHLVTIAPASAVYFGLDFPIRSNIFSNYLMQWLTLVAGRTLQDKLFWGNERFWADIFRAWFESGEPFRKLDAFVGNPSRIFQEWISHPDQDQYWDRYNPAVKDYAGLRLPILTITGIYDNAQSGALAHYRRHLESIPNEDRAWHFLVIGPWDHAGTRAPQKTIAGLTLEDASLIDLNQLHLEWYAWIAQGGVRPQFLRKNVAYYVCGANQWRYVDRLEDVTARTKTFYLDFTGGISSIFSSGRFKEQPGSDGEHFYVYDPRNTAIAELEAAFPAPLGLRPAFPTESLVDQEFVYQREQQQLIYHSDPFPSDVEVTGFFRFCAWIAIDQPDTDFQVSVFEIDHRGQSILLSADAKSARYRQSAREQRLIDTTEPLLYDFSGFTFVSRLIRKGSRLRLAVGPVHSMYSQKNHNGGGVVVDESIKDSRPVTVRLFHGSHYPSALHVPFGSFHD